MGDDAELFARAEHDAAAFEALYRRHVRRVAAYAASRCSSADDVADVVAQTFVRLLAAAGRFDPARGGPEAFVLGIAANVVRDLHRRTTRQRALAARVSGAELLDADDTTRIDAAIDAARAASAARRALDAMPPGEGDVLRLVARGASPGEAAVVLGISPGAARVRLSRARHRIRTRLATDTEKHR
ncbi:MAG: RNA polymerase sigma factor [Acidimicrobiales bacterium]